MLVPGSVTLKTTDYADYACACNMLFECPNMPFTFQQAVAMPMVVRWYVRSTTSIYRIGPSEQEQIKRRKKRDLSLDGDLSVDSFVLQFP